MLQIGISKKKVFQCKKNVDCQRGRRFKQTRREENYQTNARDQKYWRVLAKDALLWPNCGRDGKKTKIIVKVNRKWLSSLADKYSRILRDDS